MKMNEVKESKVEQKSKLISIINAIKIEKKVRGIFKITRYLVVILDLVMDLCIRAIKQTQPDSRRRQVRFIPFLLWCGQAFK